MCPPLPPNLKVAPRSLSLLVYKLSTVILNYPTWSLCIQHYLCLIFIITLFHLRFQISLLQYEKFIITTQDFPRTPAIIRTNYGKFSLRYLIIKDHLRGIPLIIIQNKLLNLAAKFLNKKSRHSFLKLTSEIRVSQNFKRHLSNSCLCITLAYFF